MTTATVRIPVPVNCQHCGNSFDTTADTVCRCPGCHKAVRIPAALRRERDRSKPKPQVSGPLPATPQVRARPEPPHEPVKIIPLPRSKPETRKTAVAAMQEHGIDPVDLKYVPDWNEPEPEPEPDNDYDDIAYEQIRQAQLNAVAGMIRQSSRVRNARVHPGPTGPFQMSLLPRAIVTDFDTGSIIGTVVRRAVNRRGRPADTYQRCAYCGAMPGVSTSGLFRVRSPGVEGDRILCQMHAQQESLIPGCVVQTL